MSYHLLRLILGVLCVLFAIPFGRSYWRLRNGHEKQSKTIGWGLRTLITGAATSWGAGFDLVTLSVLIGAAVGFGVGCYLEWRPKHEDELEKVMFPPE